MRSHFCAIHFVYVTWLKKRNKTASWLDGIMVLALMALINLFIIIGLINPKIVEWISNRGKLEVCIVGVVIYILLATLLTCALGDRQQYSCSVRKAFSRLPKKIYHTATISWMSATALLCFPIIMLIAKYNI